MKKETTAEAPAEAMEAAPRKKAVRSRKAVEATANNEEKEMKEDKGAAADAKPAKRSTSKLKKPARKTLAAKTRTEDKDATKAEIKVVVNPTDEETPATEPAAEVKETAAETPAQTDAETTATAVKAGETTSEVQPLAEQKPSAGPEPVDASAEVKPTEEPAADEAAAEVKPAEEPAKAEPAVEEKPAGEKDEAKDEAPRSGRRNEQRDSKPRRDGKPESARENSSTAEGRTDRQRQPQQPAKPREINPNIIVRDFCDLVNQGARIPMLNDQQIQQLSYEEATLRCEILERIIRSVLDYDIVLSDTNIWLELQVGHTSSHSDPRVNARLQFERQLESLSKMTKRIGGRFMIMSETYEEVDRFASVLDPVSYKDADWTDEVLCRNVAARLAKRLMLAQQKENRLRIEGIGSESHHSAFADPAIIRRTVELFAEGKKVLLLTNDASVGIRSLGMCDDLQRVNKVDDRTWRQVYEPQRPMVLTMDDLKVLDLYTRQYHFLQMASGRQWMQDVEEREPITLDKPLQLWLDGFRPGDRHERRSDRIEQQRKEQQRKEQQKQEQQQREAERKAEQERREQQRQEQQQREAEKKAADMERREAQRKADRERAARKRQEQEQKAAEAEAETTEPAAPVAEPVATPDEQPTQALPAETPEPETAEPTPEEKPRSSRRGGRGRRGGKPKNAG